MINDIGTFNGMKVLSNPMALVATPVREHKKTGTQSDFYHERIQKKWNKRFGFKQVPGIYMMNMPDHIFGGTEQVIVAHPTVIGKLKELPTGAGIKEKHRPKPDIRFKSSYGVSPLKDIYRPRCIIDLDTSA